MKIEVGGQIQGISLSSFLQIVQMDKTSCTLKIYSNDEVGYLWLSNGNLVAAETGGLDGLKAVYEIICWNDTVIVIDNTPAPKHNITTPLITILMEGLRLRDDKAAQTPRAAEAAPPAPRKESSIDDEIAMQFVMETRPEKTPPLADVPPLATPATPTTPPVAPAKASRPLHPAVAMDLVDESKAETESDGTWLFEYEDEEVKEPVNPARTLLTAFLTLIVIAGILFGGYIGFRAHALKTEYTTLMADLTAMTDLHQQKSLLETYLNTHVVNRFTRPVTENLNEANALIDLDTRIEAMPRDGDYIGTAVGLYKEHLKTHRGTPFMNALRARMKSLPAQLDDLDYARIKKAGGTDVQTRLGLYRGYLNNHPEGKYVREVTNLVASVSDEYYLMLKEKVPSCYKAQNWEPCIAVADTFTAEFPEERRFNEVWLLRGEMIDLGQLKEMRRQAAGLSFAEARNLYVAYLQKTPNSTIGDEVRKEIASLGQKAEQQGQWNEVRAIADNPEKPINVRIQEVALFIERYPDGAFVREARQKKNNLESQRSRLMKEERFSREDLAAQQAEQRRMDEQRQARLAQEQAASLARNKRESSGRLRAKEAEITGFLQGTGRRFLINNNGTLTDTQSGLTWMVLDSKNMGFSCTGFAEARAWANALTTGGFTDWRLPTPNELALLYNGIPHYPSSGAPWYWTAEVETGAWGTNTEAVTFNPNNKESFKRETHPLNHCGHVHAVRTP